MKVRPPVNVRMPIDKKPSRADKREVVPVDSYQSQTLAVDLPPLHKYQKHMEIHARTKWLNVAVAYLRAFVAEGMSRAEVKRRLGINDKTYDRIEVLMMETDGLKLANMGTAQRYLEFVLRQEQCIRDLDMIIRNHATRDPRTSGVVGAIKAKSQVLKDVLTVGQELGIISKRAKELRVLGDINLALLPTDEIQQLLFTRLTHFRDTVSEGPKLPSAYAQILDKSSISEDDEEIIDADFDEAD